MQIKYSDIRARIMALFLTILFIGYAGNNILFVHTHYIDGVMIVHSHPFGDTHHTANAASAISFLTHFISTVAASAIAIATLRILLHVYTVVSDVIRRSIHIHLSFLRAPPYFV